MILLTEIKLSELGTEFVISSRVTRFIKEIPRRNVFFVYFFDSQYIKCLGTMFCILSILLFYLAS